MMGPRVEVAHSTRSFMVERCGANSWKVIIGNSLAGKTSIHCPHKRINPSGGNVSPFWLTLPMSLFPAARSTSALMAASPAVLEAVVERDVYVPAPPGGTALPPPVTLTESLNTCQACCTLLEDCILLDPTNGAAAAAAAGVRPSEEALKAAATLPWSSEEEVEDGITLLLPPFCPMD